MPLLERDNMSQIPLYLKSTIVLMCYARKCQFASDPVVPEEDQAESTDEERDNLPQILGE